MSFHDTPQQPVQPASSRTARSSLPRRAMRNDPDSADRRGTSCIRLARAIRRANRAGADTRPRPHANARDKGSPRCRACLVEREPHERSRRTPCPSSSLPPPPTGYRMHTFHFGLSPRLLSLLHGHSPPFRRPREGGDPALTHDAAAAGEEEAGPPRSPQEPRLDPGSGAGVTESGHAV